MNAIETKIHEVVDINLTNLLDKIDLAIYHIEKSNEEYQVHIQELQKCKRSIKKILNTDFDRLAISRK